MHFRIFLLLAMLGIGSFAADIPRKSPEFVVMPPDGKQVLLSSYRGKVVCFLFILTTWPHCQKTTQVLSGLVKELGPKGFAAVAGVINDNPNIPDFIRRFNPGFPVGEANHLGAYEYMQMRLTDRVFVPYMVFIDRKGMIRSQYTGTDPILNEAQSEKLLRDEALKYLNESAGPAKAKPAHK